MSNKKKVASHISEWYGISTLLVTSSSCISDKAQVQAHHYRTVKLYKSALCMQTHTVPHQLEHSSTLKYIPMRPRIINR